MLLQRIYDDDLAQASYLIGCQAENTAVVVDPHRNVQVYLDEAARNGMTITDVTETHVHADYLSGARELAAATGARLHLSDEGGPDWQYGFEHHGLRDGSRITLGNITLTAVHTPGHTPEHLSFLVTDGAATDQPGFLLTGDFVFVGDVGRPDLLDEAAGGVDTRFEGAQNLFASLRDRFLTLPDYVQVLPGHGAGSACGKALGAVPTSTVGYERRFAWWADYVQDGDRQGFIDALLEGQPDAPAYFGRMKRHNRDGPALLGQRAPLPELRAEDVQDDPQRVVVDTRAREAYLRDGVKGALHVPFGTKFATYASYAVDPERDDRALVLLASDAEQAATMRDALARVGIDRVAGYVTDVSGFEREAVATVAPEDLGDLDDATVLDVRSRSEHDAGHLPDARQVHVGRLAWTLDEVPRDRPLVVHCQSGARAAVAEGILRDAGFERVIDLEGSYEGWERARDTQAAVRE